MKFAPMYARQLNGVIIYYKRTDIIDDVPFVRFYTDIADANGTKMYLNGGLFAATEPPYNTAGTPTITDWDPDVASLHVELTGGYVNYVKADVVAEAIPNFAGLTQDQRYDWWAARDPSLRDPKIDEFSVEITPVGVYDSTGASVVLADYPNEVKGTPLFNWMGVKWKEAWVVCTAKFDMYNSEDEVTANMSVPGTFDPASTSTKRLAYKCLLTNAVTQEYAAVSGFGTSEFPAYGTAAKVYDSVKNLTYSGTIELYSDPVRTDITVGKKLKLVGPNHTFENCIVQQVRYQPHSGMTAVTFGPSATLDAAGMVELARTTRQRLTWEMPSGRSTASPPAQGRMDMSGPFAADSNSNGSATFNYFSVTQA